MNATRSPGGVDARRQVDGGAALLVHDPELDRVLIQAQNRLDEREDLIGERDLGGAVHLGFDDVDAARSSITTACLGSQIVEATEGGDHRIEQPFGHVVPVDRSDRGCRHQMTDVANQHQSPTGHGDNPAVGAGEGPVIGHGAGEGRTILGDLGGEVPAHETEPVVVHERLVVGIDRCDRVLAIHDGGEGGFEHHVGHAGSIARSNRVGPVDTQFDTEAVVPKQDRRRFGRVAEESHEDLRLEKAERHRIDLGDQGAPVDVIAGHRRMRSAIERHHIVEETLGPSNHPLTALRIVGPGAGEIAHGVGPVESVIQRTPSGVGGIDRIPGVHDGNDELGTGDGGDLRIDVGGLDHHVIRWCEKVADVDEERLVGVGIVGLTGP